MSIAEAKRLALIENAIRGERTVSEVAELLSVSERHVKRMKKGVREFGPAYLIHGNRGRTPANAIDKEYKEAILTMATQDFRDTSCEHMAELLKEHKGITVSAKSIIRILKVAGLPLRYSKKQARRRRSRDRMPRKGMLLQCDASPYHWLEDRAPSASLHGAIDDATSQVVALCFRPTEDLHGYMVMLKQVINNHGIPKAIYSDRHSIFFSPKKDKLSIEDELAGKLVALTQFGTALSLLGINHVAARTPQAKGRVERLWQTLQSRLVVEMRIAGINTIEEANAFLPGFIDRFNKRFAVKPKDHKDEFRLPPDDELVEEYLSYREKRSATAGSAISYYGVTYQLVDHRGRVLSLRPRASIQLLTTLDGTTMAVYDGQKYALRILPKPERQTAKAPANDTRVPSKPGPTHPWNQYIPSKPPSPIEKYVQNKAWHGNALGGGAPRPSSSRSCRPSSVPLQ